MIKVNGTTIKTPATLQFDIMDIDGATERNANGELIRDRIATKRKLNMTWSALNDAELKSLLNAVKDVFFSVEYYDPMIGGLTTKTFYVGDRNMPLYNYKLKIWESMTANFIEK